MVIIFTAPHLVQSNLTFTQLYMTTRLGIAKVLVGQIVEESLEVQDSLKETGPIHPKHIRDAVRRLRNQGKLGISHHRKNKLKRL